MDIHFEPIWETQMCEENNFKYVKVHEINYKHQINVIIFSTTNKNILSFQAIFQGLTLKYLHLKNDEHIACEDDG
jgi:hypothetical protein